MFAFAAHWVNSALSSVMVHCVNDTPLRVLVHRVNDTLFTVVVHQYFFSQLRPGLVDQESIHGRYQVSLGRIKVIPWQILGQPWQIQSLSMVDTRSVLVDPKSSHAQCIPSLAQICPFWYSKSYAFATLSQFDAKSQRTLEKPPAIQKNLPFHRKLNFLPHFSLNFNSSIFEKYIT